MNQMLNPLARARGLGSAKHGVHHWLAQRTTAGILLFLIPWLAYAIVSLSGESHTAAVEFLSRPWNASLTLLWLATTLYHTTLGLQVVVEDYVHNRPLEFLLQFTIRFAALAALFTGAIYILKLVLGA